LKIALLHDRVGGKAGGGGGVRLMLELGLALEELGHQVVVATHEFEPGTEFADASRKLDIRSVRTGPTRLPRTRRDLFRLHRRGMRTVAKLVPAGVDIVNSHEWPALRAGVLAGSRLDVPHVWTRNDETPFERAVIPEETMMAERGAVKLILRGFFGIRDLRDARSSDAIVVLSDRHARMVERAYHRQATVLRHGPASAFFDPPPRRDARRAIGVEDGVSLVLGVGILLPHRRFEDLIEALGLVQEPSLQAVIVGSDHLDQRYARKLEDLIVARGLRDRVRLQRRSISEEELRGAYAAADLFVFPNQRQSYGLAPLEALATGTPVIVSSGAGVHEVIADRPGVVVVPPEDPPQLAAAIRRWIGGEVALDAVETRRWLNEELSNRRYAEQMLAVYRRAVANASNTSRGTARSPSRTAA
jgi:glycosyltransferase involved in cell wall biosynthesis